jgi:poly(glycerol-phosphate) alpha-glucosyltransferase
MVEKEQINPTSARTQFEQEAQMLKALMYDMINNGQTEDAKQLIEQYALLNPSDPEIRKIRDLIHPEGTQSQTLNIPEEYALLNNVDTFFIISGIITKKTGFFNSIFGKLKLMEEKWGYRPLVITTIPNLDQRQTQIWLQTLYGDRKMMSSGIRMLNVYDYYQKTFQEGLENKAIYSVADDGKRYEEKAGNAYDVFEGDALIRQEFYTGYSGSLRMVRHYKNGRKEKDCCYDDWGYLSFVRLYDKDNGKSYRAIYYTTDGKICIEAAYSNIDDKNEPEKLIVYDADGMIIKECTDYAELAAQCMSEIMSDDKFYVVIAEDGLMSKAAAIIEKKNVARGIVVHSIFLEDAYNQSSEPQLYYRYLCNNPTQFNAVIFMTGDARNDFVYKYGDLQNTFVIPHPYPYEIIRTDFDIRNHRKAVIIARLVIEKQINLAVDIFKLVVDKLPDVKLEIYGSGPEDKKLLKQIKTLGLENNVFLMGYTDDANEVIGSAALFMMTSWAEGFGLTLVESISNGCPAFAFDIKYGPADIIKDGETGFLIPRFDKRKYAKKMVEYFEDANMQRIMSDICYAEAPGFSTDRFLEKWFSMTKTLYERRG